MRCRRHGHRVEARGQAVGALCSSPSTRRIARLGRARWTAIRWHCRLPPLILTPRRRAAGASSTEPQTLPLGRGCRPCWWTLPKVGTERVLTEPALLLQLAGRWGTRLRPCTSRARGPVWSCSGRLPLGDPFYIYTASPLRAICCRPQPQLAVAERSCNKSSVLPVCIIRFSDSRGCIMNLSAFGSTVASVRRSFNVVFSSVSPTEDLNRAPPARRTRRPAIARSQSAENGCTCSGSRTRMSRRGLRRRWTLAFLRV